jgi:hypothetical protein
MPHCTDMQLQRIQQNKLITETSLTNPMFYLEIKSGCRYRLILTDPFILRIFFVVRGITQSLYCLS